jgi:integrase
VSALDGATTPGRADGLETRTEDEKKPRREKRTGAIAHRADGTWIARIELPRDPMTGKRRQKVVRAKDEKDAKKKLDKLRLDLARAGDLPTSSMTTEKWMRYWLDNIDRSRPRTREGYRSKIEHYIIPAIGRIKLDKLTPADIRRLEQYIVKDKKLSSTSALQAHAILSKALKDAEADGRVVKNVATVVSRPRKAATSIDILTAQQAAHVYETIRGERLASRYAAALLTGARQGELLGLQVDHVDFTRGQIVFAWQLQRIRLVEGKLDAASDWEHRQLAGGLYLARPKSKAGWRTIPLVEPLRTILEARIAEAETEPNPHGLVWTADAKKDRATHQLQPLDGAPIDPSWDSKHWHQILQRAGVPDVKLHAARHTAVTLLYELGVPEHIIAQIVGHSAVTVTRGYGHNTLGPAAGALTQLGAMFTPELSALKP